MRRDFVGEGRGQKTLVTLITADCLIYALYALHRLNLSPGFVVLPCKCQQYVDELMRDCVQTCRRENTFQIFLRQTILEPQWWDESG